MLEGFILHNETRIKQFQKILMEMKKDYEEMYNSLTKDALLITSIEVGHGIQYIENVVENLNSKNAGSDIAALSMGIQKGKYDGTKESFEKLTL